MSTCSIIIQGEGKGHFSQAMTLYKFIKVRNMEVENIYIGRSLFRKSPDYFSDEVNIRINTFISPNFIRTPDRKGIHISLSLLLNFFLSPVYIFESARLGIRLLLDRT